MDRSGSDAVAETCCATVAEVDQTKTAAHKQKQIWISWGV